MKTKYAIRQLVEKSFVDPDIENAINSELTIWLYLMLIMRRWNY